MSRATILKLVEEIERVSGLVYSKRVTIESPNGDKVTEDILCNYAHDQDYRDRTQKVDYATATKHLDEYRLNKVKILYLHLKAELNAKGKKNSYESLEELNKEDFWKIYAQCKNIMYDLKIETVSDENFWSTYETSDGVPLGDKPVAEDQADNYEGTA